MVLFSDLHGHHDALHQLLRQFPDEKVISVGDVLGRAGSNMACLEALRQRNIPSLQGNHELRMLDSIYRNTVEDWAADWIRGWPLEFIDEEALIVHTLLELRPDGVDFISIERPEHAEQLMRRRSRVFTGHLHLPGYWSWDQQAPPRWTSVRTPTTLELAPDCRYLFQVGSLGEPLAEHLPRFLIWNQNRVEWRRLEPCPTLLF